MSKQALIIIDFINELANPQGKLATGYDYLKTNNVISNANLAIDYARNQNWLLIFVNIGFSEDYIECPINSPVFGKAPEFQVLKLGTWSTQFVDELHYQENDLVITKNRVSPFYATKLDLVLRNNKVNEIFITGFSTDMAVQCTAREAHDRDYKVNIIADACGAHNEINHQSTLKLLERIATIVNIKDFITTG